MHVDPWILTFSLATVIATIWMGFWSARRSKTAHDFFVAGRSVSVGWNASAISGEYLSAASFMGVAGMVMKNGYDALWYPVCYACGYLFLLLFIAGPLRRFGAYTIPDFAEGRYDSPVFRKIAVIFVLFIGFFYTMPQMKGAGTTLAYIFPGLPYWAGVVLVGAVITLNVALGGMKGITLVQAFQYWLKLFAISVPIFVLMAVYGHYGKQVGVNGGTTAASTNVSAIVERLQSAQTFRSSFPAPEQSLDLVKKIGVKRGIENAFGTEPRDCRPLQSGEAHGVFGLLAHFTGWKLVVPDAWPNFQIQLTPMTNWPPPNVVVPRNTAVAAVLDSFSNAGLELMSLDDGRVLALPVARKVDYIRAANQLGWLSLHRAPLPAKAPADETWLNPFGPLTTKAAKAAAQAIQTNVTLMSEIALPAKIATNTGVFKFTDASTEQMLDIYADLTGHTLLPRKTPVLDKLDMVLQGQLTRLHLREPVSFPHASINAQSDKPTSAGELKTIIETCFATNGISLVAVDAQHFRAVRTPELQAYRTDLAKNAQQRWLDSHQRPLALLYTYSLIIALVCGTAGLPHILVRFYTNPDGAAAKRTTMWVMILIGVFYLFPPVFGVLGRNLLPDLYAAAGAKGTDKIVLELPRVINERFSGWGSVLSGITCAGAFAAFMSTFSGLLVSMTGALAHDVYGRIFRPRSTPEQRLKAFKIAAVVVGAVAIVLGMQVEQFDINFMVGQAFAIAAASYFPLLFLSAWWRKMTMKGAAAGMLSGGVLALAGISLTSFSDLKWLPLEAFWAGHPLLRILCEQPAIWTVPLAITLMVVVSRATSQDVPSDARMKMLVLHAPEELGLKQEYIQEHQAAGA